MFVQLCSTHSQAQSPYFEKSSDKFDTFYYLTMFLLVVSALPNTYVNLQKILKGKWEAHLVRFEGNSTVPVESKSVVSFRSSESDAHLMTGILEGTDEYDEFVCTLNFRERGLFSMSVDKKEIAEFEFFGALHPHLTATGKWYDDCVFSAEFISSTSLHLSLFNHTSLTSEFVTLSSLDDREKNFIEKNFITVLTIGYIFFKVVKREYSKRQFEMQMRKRGEEQMRKLEEEEQMEEEQKDEESN